MKRTFTLILAFIILFACLPARAEHVSVMADHVDEASFPMFTVNWQKKNDYYILTASWEVQGDQWEACITGLPEKLTAYQIRLLLSAAMQNKNATISCSGLIDAEKATNKLPLDYGVKFVTDPISQDISWGDSQHCWAASVSNMLELTGWIRNAAEPDTSRRFTGTDDLFGFFNRAFRNEGTFFDAAFDWVFQGIESGRLAIPRPGIQGPLIKDAPQDDVYLNLCVDQFDTVDKYMALMCERLPLLKLGYAIGTALSICPIDYALKSDPTERVSHDSALDAFVRYESPIVSRDQVRETLFVPDARNGLPLPVVYDEAAECYREERSGTVVEPHELWKGKLAYDQEQDMWFTIDKNFYYDDKNDPPLDRIVFFDEDEVDLTRPYDFLSFVGQHAVTVMGYVMNLSEKKPARRIKALILADSDNDAVIYKPDQNTPRREDRPNTYTLYPAETIDFKGHETITLNTYLPHDRILLYSVTALAPAPEPQPDPPIPKTGDDTPLFLCAALMILSAYALIWLRREAR